MKKVFCVTFALAALAVLRKAQRSSLFEAVDKVSSVARV